MNTCPQPSPCSPSPPPSRSPWNVATGIPELDDPPEWWLQWHDCMAAAAAEKKLRAAGIWPQGSRDLYANPYTAAYNKALAQALIAAMR